MEAALLDANKINATKKKYLNKYNNADNSIKIIINNLSDELSNTNAIPCAI